MENEQFNNFINTSSDKNDENAYGPHTNDYDNFFTVLYKCQDISKDPLFIQWEKDMRKYNSYHIIVQCPNCNAYFPNEGDFDCHCRKCKFKFCLGCGKGDCTSGLCIKFWSKIFHFFGLKEYREKNIIIKICMYFSMLFQILFIFPLLVIYKFGPLCLGDKENDGLIHRDKDIKYKKTAIKLCLLMLPYQVAFLGFWFNVNFLLFFFPGIFYPPYTIYWMGIFLHFQRNCEAGVFR